MLARRLFAAAFLLGTLTAFAPAPLPKPGQMPSNLEAKLQGTWEVIEVRRGAEASELQLQSGAKIRISEESWRLLSSGASSGSSKSKERGKGGFGKGKFRGPPSRSSTTYTIALDPRQKPCAIDLLTKSTARTSLRGILILEGDQLKICLVPSSALDGERPKSIRSADPRATFLLLRREK